MGKLAEYRRKRAQKLLRYENAFAADIRKLFKEQGRILSRSLAHLNARRTMIGAAGTFHADRNLRPDDNDRFLVDVQHTINQTESAWKATFKSRLSGAFKLNGKQTNGGVVRTTAAIDLKMYNDRAAAFVSSRVPKLTGDIQETTLARVSNLVKRGIQQGDSVAETAKSIRSLFDDMAMSRAYLIAQVETGIGASTGDYVTAQLAEQDTMKGWSSAEDEKVRDSHQIDGEFVEMDDLFSNDMMYPLWPDGPIEEIANCFIGETAVESVDAQGLFRQFYRGQVVTIQTASGIKLTGTPNHPILTPGGWKALGDVNESDHLISGRFVENRLSLANPHADDVPARLHDLYDSFVPFFERQRIANRYVNFYGDKGTGDVDYIALDRLLRYDGHASPAKPSDHVEFASTDLAFAERCAPNEKLFIAPHCGMRSLSHAGTFLGSGARHSQNHCLPAGTRFNATLTETPGDSVAVTAQCASDHLYGLSRMEAANDVINIQSPTIAGAFDTPFDKALRNQVRTTAETISHLLKTQSVLSGIDKVVAVERSDFSGHIFTLATRRGYYIANGVIVKNCRCAALYVPRNEVEDWT